MSAFGGFTIAAGVTGLYVTAGGVKLTSTNVPTLAALGTTKQGDKSVVEAASTGRLTLKPGVYNVSARLTIDGDGTSGTSGDGTGDITGQLYLAGVAVAGTKGKVNTDGLDKPIQVSFGGVVEVTAAQQAAGTNYVEFYLSSGDAKGNDLTISEGQILATRLDG